MGIPKHVQAYSQDVLAGLLLATFSLRRISSVVRLLHRHRTLAKCHPLCGNLIHVFVETNQHLNSLLGSLTEHARHAAESCYTNLGRAADALGRVLLWREFECPA